MKKRSLKVYCEQLEKQLAEAQNEIRRLESGLLVDTEVVSSLKAFMRTRAEWNGLRVDECVKVYVQGLERLLPGTATGTDK